MLPRFNHIQDNHIHLESDYHVCPTCGSLDECPHDEDGSTVERGWRQPLNGQSGSDTYEMVTNAHVQAGEEVFNTYGEHLSNAELLARYGFMLDSNENDSIQWYANELPWIFGRGIGSATPNPESPECDESSFSTQADAEDGSDQQRAPKRRRLASPTRVDNGTARTTHEPAGFGGVIDESRHALELRLLSYLIAQWPDSTMWESSNLVAPVGRESAGSDGNTLLGNDEVPRANTPIFQLNADGKVSHHLWVYAATVGLLQLRKERDSEEGRRKVVEEVENRPSDYIGMLQRAAQKQVELECAVEERQGASEEQGLTEDDLAINLGGGASSYEHAIEAEISDESLLHFLTLIARQVIRLCEDRRHQMACSSSQEVNERLDALPADMKRTRMAMTETLTELSMLESCECAWKELEEICGST
ncbi:hypothetical protein PUNSTDRAFT_136969 [Punctularia strigosozonata HHB-11173 SS5]|uniref:uncharacterized protein n=1 Tax=Punctularia strigosozonata (strain HHB-11173) TaxID=741275 RepID=UPI0004417F3F|nr:uncharacterized protein PUNSTDRAFT_136969 [Punctularia strigosozonata HHB-11173 SS5]EIN06179.1 hypothetical protein PUNSTDRAFT_136969 [Punctularia strigosozonata HHB-11173 SS5]